MRDGNEEGLGSACATEGWTKGRLAAVVLIDSRVQTCKDQRSRKVTLYQDINKPCRDLLL